jgi:hypothetical protein
MENPSVAIHCDMGTVRYYIPKYLIGILFPRGASIGCKIWIFTAQYMQFLSISTDKEADHG